MQDASKNYFKIVDRLADLADQGRAILEVQFSDIASLLAC